MITCQVRYEIDPAEIEAFERGRSFAPCCQVSSRSGGAFA
jgi:hypothetical protein